MPTVIDADVHLEVPRIQTLFPYLDEHWIEHFTNTLDRGATQRYYPPRSPITAREPQLKDGGSDESGLARLQREALDPGEVEVAVTSCLYAVDSIHNPDVAVACASALNDWQTKEWLEIEPRIRGSIVVPIQIPALAVAEIERVADHPGFVQVLLPARTEHPLGSRLFHPLWETIERLGLVAGIHFGGAPVMPPTPTGWPSYFLEEYTAMAGVFATQLTSLVVEGVFDKFPTLRVALLESGFTWLPAHMWRMDKEWRNLRRQVPWVRRPPSDYVREHVRVGIQPLDPPPETSQLLEVVDQLECEEMLLYASDYPHRHAFDAEETLLGHLPESLGRKIRSENARSFYRL